MLKKNKVAIFLFIILSCVSIYFLNNRKLNTYNEAKTNFATAEIEKVQMIYLADKNKNFVKLSHRGDNEWMVNDQYLARKDAMKTILITLQNLRIKSSINSKTFNSVVGTIAAQGIKCELYFDSTSKEPTKVIYIGSPTPDNLGTYMMLANSNSPYIMELPGFNGYLSGRFSTRAEDWRDPSIFRCKLQNISSVSIDYPFNQEQSFKIDVGNGQYKIQNATGIVQNLDSNQAQNYLSYYGYLTYEGRDNTLSSKEQDSLSKATPLIIINLIQKNGSSITVPFYKRKVGKASLAQFDEAGKPLIYDVDRLFALINNKKELVSVQQYQWGKIFRKFQDFNL